MVKRPGKNRFDGSLRKHKNNRKTITKIFKNRCSLKRTLFENMFFNNVYRCASFLNCQMCKNKCTEPITVECGHTFCSKCVQSIENCIVCQQEVINKNAVNVLLQKLLDQMGICKLADLTDNIFSSVGLEPRYWLRSRYAGLQFKQTNSAGSNATKRDRNFDKLIKKHGLLQNVSKHKRNRLRRNKKEKALDTKKFESNLQNIFEEVENIQERTLKIHWNNADYDLDCILCGQCMLEPVTTSCGHSFCRECLTRVLDHRLCCPLCMSDLNVDDYFRGITTDLDGAINFFLPVERRKRILDRHREIQSMENKFEVPIFVCTNAFPGVACPLYVYEPQYRLLTRRCLQTSTRRFAMVAKDNHDNKFVTYGTILEIKDAVRLQDGRFILATLGLRRFKVLHRGEHDGYDMAKITYIKDSIVSMDKIPEMIELHKKVYKKASKWVKSLTPKVYAEVERLIGHMPKIETNWITLPDGPSWTWWLMPILPLSSQLQVVFLSTVSLDKRLRAIDKMLEHMKIRMRALERETIKYHNKNPILDDDACDDSYML